MNRLQSWIPKSGWKSFLAKEQARNEERIFEVKLVIKDILDKIIEIDKRQLELIDRMSVMALCEAIGNEIESWDVELNRLDDLKKQLVDTVKDREEYLNILVTNYGEASYRLKTTEGYDRGTE